MNKGVVYRVTCSATGDTYIGQTRSTVARRWGCHVSSARSYPWKVTPLLEAIRAHGFEAFTVETLAAASTRAGLDALERRLITELQPTLNVREGGRICTHMRAGVKNFANKMGRTSRDLPAVSGTSTIPSTDVSHMPYTLDSAVIKR